MHQEGRPKSVHVDMVDSLSIGDPTMLLLDELCIGSSFTGASTGRICGAWALPKQFHRSCSRTEQHICNNIRKLHIFH